MISAPAHVSEILSREAALVAEFLLPNGKRNGNEWCVGSVHGEAGKSCKVHLTGDRAGVWADFADGDKGGDLLDLWCAVRGIGIKEAMGEACDFLNIDMPKFEGYKKREYKRPDKPKCSKPRAQPAAVWLRERNISDDATEAYKVGIENGDTIVFPYLRGDELIHVKFRQVPKKFWSSAETEPCLFGWQAIPKADRSVVICEGEMDALAWYEYGYPALSMPYGTGSGAKLDWIEHEFDELSRFDMILLSMDMDEKGQQAIAEIVERLGRHRVKLIELPAKDANQCLMDGVSRSAITEAVNNARTLDPRELRNAHDYLDELIKQFYPPAGTDTGILLPWDRTKMGELRLRTGEVTILSGYNGHGKSEGVGHIVAEGMAQGVKCCVASLEFKPRKWLARLARQVSAQMVPEIALIHRMDQWWRDKLWAFDSVGMSKFDRTIEVFDYAYRRYGCRLFVLDNLTKCGIDEDDYNGQKNAVAKLCEFAVDTDTHVILVAHNRKAESDTAAAGKMDVRGHGSITDQVDNVIVWWRNRVKEKKLALATIKDEERQEELKKPDAFCKVEKQRNGEGEEPTYSLWFDKVSHQFMDSRYGAAKRYVS